MIYEYKCQECEHVFELSLRVSECDLPKKEPCPECQTEGKVERYFSTVPRLSYSSTGSPMGDQKFQKEVLNPILNKVPEHMRGSNKFKTTSEF